MLNEVKKKQIILDDSALPEYIQGVMETGDYVADKEALQKSKEKNCELIASLGEEFAHISKS